MTSTGLATGDDIAAALRTIGEALVGHAAMSSVTLRIQIADYGRRAERERIAQLDSIALLLTGLPGVTERVGDGHQHRLDVEVGPVDFGVYTAVTPPDPRDAEIARLRAELAARDAAPVEPIPCPFPGDQEHDHAMCQDVAAEGVSDAA